MKHYSLIIYLLSLVVSLQLSGQTTGEFSLIQAQDYALKNAFAIKSVRNDAENATNTTKELLAIGLPQINGSATYLNNIYAPFNIIPAGSFGPTETRVRFQQPQNITLGVTASQLLFDGTWLVGLEASRSYESLQKKNIEKSEIAVKDEIAQAYYLAVVASENTTILSESRVNLAKLNTETSAYYEAGFVEKQTLDQLNLTLNNLDIQISYAKEQERFVRDLLKFKMGYPLQQEITLTEKTEALMSLNSEALTSAPFNAQENIDVELAKSGLLMQQLSLKSKKAAYLPNLAASWTIQTQAQRGQFDFFDTSRPFLYGNFLVVQMNVPILSGGSRKYGTKKAEVEVKKMQDATLYAEQGAELEYRNAKIELDNAAKVFESSKMSLKLAEDIYKTSEIKFKEGVGSSTDLTTNNNQLLEAQGAYVQSMLKLLQSKNRLAKALNQY